MLNKKSYVISLAGSAIYYMDNKDAKMEAKIRRAWVNLSVEEDTADLFTLDGIVRGAGKRKIKKPQRAFQDAEVSADYLFFYFFFYITGFILSMAFLEKYEI